MAEDSGYQQQYLNEIVGGFMPQLNQQKKGMYDYLLGNTLRTGQSATAVAEGLRPYAEASGQAAAEAGVQASQMAQQQEQFDAEQEAYQASLDQQQSQFEQDMAFQQQQADLNAMIAIYNETGVMTPELIEALGYDPSEYSAGDFSTPDSEGGSGGGTPGSWNNWGGQTGLIYG